MNALHLQVARSLAEGRWQFARHFCDRLLAEDSRNLEGWLVRGLLAWKQLENPQEAMDCFRKVVILGGYDSSNECVARARASLSQILAQLS